MYNEGPAQTPVFRMELPKGRYMVTAETLEGRTKLGKISSEQLSAPGIRLPRLNQNRFMMLRIQEP
jgi:hypothetical protein